MLVVAGDEMLLEYSMERVIEQLEARCYDGLQQATKMTEGIGIEYDEDVVCDICRSVLIFLFQYKSFDAPIFRPLSFCGRHFQTVELSAAERHVGAIAVCFEEMSLTFPFSSVDFEPHPARRPQYGSNALPQNPMRLLRAQETNKA